MNIACIHMAHFPFQVELQSRPSLRGKPTIVADLSPRERRVVDTSPQVRGVAVGMPVGEALARCSGAVLLEANLSHYQAAFERVLDSLEKVSPLVEGQELGLAYVGLDGLVELYGGEVHLLTGLRQAVIPYQASIGIGVSKFVTYLAARASDPGTARKVTKDMGSFLLDFPVDVLPLPWQATERLKSYGLYSLGV